jgi:hypothetical protein
MMVIRDASRRRIVKNCWAFPALSADKQMFTRRRNDGLVSGLVGNFTAAFSDSLLGDFTAPLLSN